MRLVEDLPHEVRTEDHFWIPMSDGVRLAGRLWRPSTAHGSPVPAVLEYIPYRRRDLTAVRDSMPHPYVAGHGYACVRVDLRGTGDSEGVLTDEYLEREQRDAEEVLAWLAEQPWCDGNTAMMGLSWGGFAALQVAARRPPSLRAVAVTSFTDDRYADDFHYMGGCLLSDNLAEAGTTFAYGTCPPDPETVGPAWRDLWLRRLEANRPWVVEWLRHQRRDHYWRHASVCEDYSRIRCPVLASSGWADGYSNAVLRLRQHLDAPVKALVGPWSHRYPHLGEPGPAIGYLQEVVRWFDHWAKGEDNGVEKETGLWAWMQESVPPSTSYEERPGRWVHEPEWPSARVEEPSLPLGGNRVNAPGVRDAAAPLSLRSPLSVGQFAGKWASYSAPPDLPYDQREEDGGSLVFDTDPLVVDTDPLERRVEILAPTRVALDLSVSEPVAMVAARLCDVAPDGSATRVTYGLLNLTHRDGHEHPRELVPGERYRVELTLNSVAQAFPPGHRIRLSLSTSYWPLAWPPPRPVLLTVWPADSALLLPERPEGTDEGRAPVEFDEPEQAAPLPIVRGTGNDRPERLVTHDVGTGEWVLDVDPNYGGTRTYPDGLVYTESARERYRIRVDDPLSAVAGSEWEISLRREGWDVLVRTSSELSATAEHFVVHSTLEAISGGEVVETREWRREIPRTAG